MLALLGLTLVLGSCSNVGGGSGATTPLTVTTEALPDGQVNTPYSSTLAATGGTVPYTWSLASGALPDGLTLNSATGADQRHADRRQSTGAALGFAVKRLGRPAQSSSANLSLTVVAFGLKITTNFLPDGQVGSAYSATLTRRRRHRAVHLDAHQRDAAGGPARWMPRPG